MAKGMNPINDIFGEIKTGVMGALNNLKTAGINAELRAKAAYSAAVTRAGQISASDVGRLRSAYINKGMSEIGADAMIDSQAVSIASGNKVVMDVGIGTRAKAFFADEKGKGGYDAWRVGGAIGAGAISTGAVAAIGYKALKD